MKPRKIFTKDKIIPLVCILFIVSGLLTLQFFPKIYESIINNEFTLHENSKAYQLWKDTPMSLAIEFYMFNWTNPEDIYDPDIKPHFVEMGPYVYIEKYEKVDLVWNDNNDTITFKQLRKWYFDPTRSNGSLDDQITCLNPVAVVSIWFGHWNFGY